MELQKMTDKQLLFLDVDWSTKEQIIDHLVDALAGAGVVTSAEAFKQVVFERENHSPTGLEKGLAIPHGKSEAVAEAKFAVARLKKPIKGWKSIDPANEVDLVFLLAIPDTEAGSTHVKLLSQLSRRLMDESYREGLYAAKTADSFMANLDNVKGSKPATAAKNEGKTVLAVTSCATGIAHTFMAAEALEKAGRELGINVLVEKQGANGIEDRHTPSAINKADAVLFAVDTKVKERSRFTGKPYVEVKVAEPLRRAKELLVQALEQPAGVVEGGQENTSAPNDHAEGGKGFLAEMTQAVMTGISYMIPVLVAAGLMLGIAKLVWLYALGLDINEIGNADYATAGGMPEFLYQLNNFGNLIFRFLYPVFGMFVAFSLADRAGIVPGLLGGVFASGLHYTIWGVKDAVPSGFLGALVLGLAAGYIARFLNRTIQLPRNLAAMKPMLLIPGISVFLIFVLNQYVVDPFFSQLNQWMATAIESMTGTGSLALSAIIAAATAFDLGGPVNKAAGAIAIGMAADNIFPLTPRVLAIVIPPLGIGLATIIDRFVVGRRVFSPDLRIAGNTSFLLGFLAISEGAIPFMLRNPLLTIPINIIGAVAGSCTAVALGAVQWYPLPAVWGWPLVEHLTAYLIGLLLGVAIIAFANIFFRYAEIKRKESRGETAL